MNKQEPLPEGPLRQTQERGQSRAAPGALQLWFSRSGVSDFPDPRGSGLPGSRFGVSQGGMLECSKCPVNISCACYS